MDTLEHLPSLEFVEKILKESIRVASNIIYIRGPMFYDDYLKKKGLRFYWAHWTGHPCHIEPDHITKILEKCKVTNYKIKYLEPVISSSDPSIHPINGQKDRRNYNRWIDPPPKPRKVKSENIYKKFEILINLRDS